MATVTIDGRRLDAAFSVTGGETPDQFIVTINSASGPKENQPGVNPDYKPALDAILTRLGSINAIVQGIWLTPTTGPRPRTLLDVQGRPFPWQMNRDDDFKRLRLGIGRAQEITNQAVGAKRSGSRTKRIEILVGLKQAATAGELEAWLAAEHNFTGSGEGDKSASESSKVSMPENRTGRELARRWGLEVQQALYRKTGDWFHQLTKFPGALLDANGYVIFETEESFNASPQLRKGDDPNRNGGWVSAPLGIKALPGYVNVAAAEPESERSSLKSFLRPQTIAQGQTWGGSAEIRRAIELYAMNLAISHYAPLWPEVIDVSAAESFDLLCRDSNRELRVEVKGTTSLGLSVLLTRNEVRHAQQNNGRVALFIVSNIVTNAEGCEGGNIHVLEPWDIKDDELEPVAFECRLGVRRRSTPK